MKGPMMTTTNFRPKYVSFDCYGTLINWDTDPTTRRLLDGRLPEDQWPAFKKVFRGYRFDEVCGDYKPYEQILQNSFDRVCRFWGLDATPGAGAALAEAVRTWGAHDDVPAPLKRMGENYQLVILSNADDSFLDISVPRLGADFHAVYTAEQAQAYKPRYQAFEYMLDTLNARPADFLHVSSHTRYDLMPMHDMGFRNLVLLDRGCDPITGGYDYTNVQSLEELNKLLGL
jgi:2-haloacid dehalogenase